jgi:uncharacterized protein
LNLVGVDVNLASEELLKYVSGLNRLIASNIVSYRNQHGAFDSRVSLMKVPGFGEKKFQLAAGFLRIPGARDPLDNSAVHPERYRLVEQMASAMNTTINELIGNTTLLRTIDKKKFITEDVGLPTIEDILSELEKPGRDPRAEFRYAHFNESITEIADLKEGMFLEGTVTNVTNFGAFVDIGVHQDGLVHISELADTFVTDPKKVVKVGDVVKVKVLTVDAALKRISLSMKVNEPSQRASQQKQNYPQSRPSSEKRVVDNKAALAQKFGGEKNKSQEQQKLKMYKPKFNIRQIMK